jgi:hypothetical protein
MSIMAPPAPPGGPLWPVRRITVEQYHRMIEAGIITAEDRVELLEGYLVARNGHNPPHDGPITVLQRRLQRLLPEDRWVVRVQMPVTLDESEPEPDLALVRGSEREYFVRKPTAADVALVVESADSSLPRDRTVKGPIYARNRLPVYWIINVVDLRVEVYTDPTGPDTAPTYRQRRDYNPSEMVPLVIDGQEVARFLVNDLLP